MKREDRKNRVSLTLLFTLCVFVILFVAVVLSFGIVYLLTFLRVLSAMKETHRMFCRFCCSWGLSAFW